VSNIVLTDTIDVPISEVIVPAISQGRRVVTNVDGIDGRKIRDYIEKN